MDEIAKRIMYIKNNKEKMMPEKTKRKDTSFKKLLEDIGREEVKIKNYLGRPVMLNMSTIGLDNDVSKYVNGLSQGYVIQVDEENQKLLVQLPSNKLVWLKPEHIMY